MLEDNETKHDEIVEKKIRVLTLIKKKLFCLC